MNELIDLIREVTTVYRKGEAVVQEGFVTHVFGYPHRDEMPPTEEAVDMYFVVVGVKPEAKDRAEEIMRYLIAWHSPTLGDGPSYIHTGGELGDQELALRLFAVGQVLGFWKVTMPSDLGITGDEEKALIGGGFLYAIPTPEFAAAVKGRK